jgi:hypothetical protein
MLKNLLWCILLKQRNHNLKLPQILNKIEKLFEILGSMNYAY